MGSCSQTTLSVGVYGIYALTSTWFVAHGVGDTAMAAVNLVVPVLLLLSAVASAVGVGGASLVSRSLGADDTASAACAAGNAFTLFWITAITTTVIGLSRLDLLLTMLGAHGALRGPARSYAIVLLSGGDLEHRVFQPGARRRPHAVLDPAVAGPRHGADRP